MSFKSLELDTNDDIYKKLQQFKVGSPSEEFKKQILKIYRIELEILTNHFLKKFGDVRKTARATVFTELCKHALFRLMTKEEKLTNSPYKWGYYEHLSRINHSCDPNLKIIDFSKYDDEGVSTDDLSFKSVKKINKGDELTFSYTADVNDLVRSYGFTCKCEKCESRTSDGKRKPKNRKKSSKSKRKSKNINSKSKKRKSKNINSKSKKRKSIK